MKVWWIGGEGEARRRRNSSAIPRRRTKPVAVEAPEIRKECR
jgi:hypothetical protein